MVYFMAIPGPWFRQLLIPALGECLRERTFRPVESICRDLRATAVQFVQSGSELSPVALEVLEGLKFNIDLWRILAGELMLFGAEELPELETPLDMYATVLGERLSEVRGEFPPIQQAIEGSRDVWFGAFYRPEHAGWNDEDDVRRLARWFSSVNPEQWKATRLPDAPPEDQEDDIAFLREWFAELASMYQRSVDSGRVIVCERM
jgi:hypothetical protein